MKISPISLYTKNISYKKPLSNKNNEITGVPQNEIPCFKSLYKEGSCMVPLLSNVSFKGVQCSPRNFEIKQVYGLDCPCCGKPMLTGKQARQKASELSNSTGEKLKDLLQGLEEYWRPAEKVIIDRILANLDSNPKADIKCIIQKEAQKSIKQLEAAQQMIFDEIKKIGSSLTPEQKSEIYNAVGRAEQIVNSPKEEVFFQRKEFIDTITALNKKYKDNNPKAFKKILDYAESLPTSQTSVDAFFVKYQRKTKNEIAQRLIDPLKSTTEHIKPQSQFGENNTRNYIPLCGNCNASRGDMSYAEWFKSHPEMMENLQNYINQIAEKLASNEIRYPEEYESYIDEIIESIRIESKGELILTKPDSKNIGNAAEETNNKEKSKEKTLDYYFSRIEQTKNTLEELRELREKLMRTKDFRLLVKKAKYEEEYRGLKQIEKDRQSVLETKKRHSKSAKRLLDRDITEGAAGSKIKSRQEACDKAFEEENKAEQDYHAARNAAKEVADKILEIRGMFISKEELSAELITLRKRLTSIQGKEKAVFEAKEKLDKKKALEDEITRIQNGIEELEEDIKSKKALIPRNPNAIKEYNLIKAKMAALDKIDVGEFERVFKRKGEFPIGFVIEEAANSLNAKLNESLKKPAVLLQKKQDDLEQLKGCLQKKSIELKKYDGTEKAYKILSEKLNVSIQRESKKDLMEKIAQLEQEQKAYYEMINNTDIDKRIQAAHNELNQLIEEHYSLYGGTD